MYQLLKPWLFRFDPEDTHDLAVRALRLAQSVLPARAALAVAYHYEDPILVTQCAGMHFLNPFGMAAGFDKGATLVPGLAALGFGHVEIGTVTPRPQSGNERPRMFRLPEDLALINRMGFNSAGMEVAAQHLDGLLHFRSAATSPIIGVNLGKNKTTSNDHAVDDYLLAFDRLAPLGDYVTINVSSPNTPGLRQLQSPAALKALLSALAARNQALAAPRPLFVKVAPDESPAQLDAIVEAVLGTGIAGIVAGNTTLARDGLRGAARGEAGGLSGQPLTARARATIRYLYQASAGTLPIIGVGGITSAQDAYGHLCAGASLVQLYSALVYQGPGVVKTLKRDLAALLRRDGVRHLHEVVGQGP